MLNQNRKIEKGDIDTIALDERVKMEAEITDARAKVLDLEKFKSLDYNEYRKANAWRRYAFDFLGDVRGKRVLDICCGYSMTPVLFALAGAEVVAGDVAPLSLEKVKEVADMRGVGERVSTYCGPAEEIPYDDNSFDIIYGGAAIHHLILSKAGPEFARILAPKGKGVFQDPLGHNMLIEFIRDNVSYPGKHPEKGTDHPLTVEKIKEFGAFFDHYDWRGFNLLRGLIVAVPGLKKMKKPFEAIDEGIFTVLPFMHRYARFSVITAQQK